MLTEVLGETTPSDTTGTKVAASIRQLTTSLKPSHCQNNKSSCETEQFGKDFDLVVTETESHYVCQEGLELHFSLIFLCVQMFRLP